jgi:GNAT superfamily N-acetyltransferase
LTANNWDAVEINHLHHPLLDQVKYIYETSFPPKERREFHVFINRYSERSPQHAGYLYALVQARQVVGITAFSVFARTGIINLSIIAAHPDMRGQGIGGALLNLTMTEGVAWFTDRGQACAGMVWEVEQVEAAENEAERAERIRRIGFYEKSGGQLIGDFTLPPLRPGQPELYLTVMFRPAVDNRAVPIDAIVETVCRETYTLPDDHPGYSTIRETWERRQR